MSLVSASPGRLSRRIATWNTTRAYCFQNVDKLRCRDALVKSSFSTTSYLETGNPKMETTEGAITKRMNLFTAINNALHIALKTDPTSILFGQDVAFGGVFRCTQGLQDEFGPNRVFNTPLSENGIAGTLTNYCYQPLEFQFCLHNIYLRCCPRFPYRSSDRLLKYVRRNGNWGNSICRLHLSRI